MTPRSLFTLVLKIFGLFFLKDIIDSIPQLFSTFLYYLNENALMNGLSTLFFSVLIILFYGVIAWYFLFKTGYLLDKLKLDNDFEQEEFSFDISQSTIISIALIVLGGVILVNEIPNFCRILFSYFLSARLTPGQAQNDYSLILFSGIKIIIGLLLIGERQKIIDFLDNKKETEPHE